MLLMRDANDPLHIQVCLFIRYICRSEVRFSWAIHIVSRNKDAMVSCFSILTVLV
jgi:hypothetical protein